MILEIIFVLFNSTFWKITVGGFCKSTNKKIPALWAGPFDFVLSFQPEVLEILVKNGADLDAKTRNGETAFGKA